MADRRRRLRRLVPAGFVVALALAGACTGGTDTPVPAEPLASGAASGGPLDAGSEHSCVVRDGTVACWGANVFGQLGDGTHTDRHTPVTLEGLRDAVVVAAGEGHTCALRSNATVACWGKNVYGDVGDGTSVLDDGSSAIRLAPVTVEGVDDVVGVTAGQGHTCALRQGGGIRCWGDNQFGQLGRHTRGGGPPAPGAVWAPGWAGWLGHRPLDDAVALAAGGWHTCAVRASGTVACWGDTEFGHLVDDFTTGRHTPVDVDGLADAVAVTAGRFHTCVLRADGSVACWGVNDWGQLGDGTDTARSTPDAVESLGDAVAVAAGGGHTCALRARGAVACWGRNNWGQLGDGSTINRSAPIVVEGINDAVALTAGGDHTCALRQGGDVACWGRNEYGQLGNATTINRSSPVAVAADR